MNTRELETNHKVALSIGIADSIDLIAIFSSFLQKTLLAFLESIGHFFMFPFAAAASMAQAVLAWREAKLTNGNSRSVLRAVVETASALAIGTAVIGSLVAAPIMGAFAPIIFTATMGVKWLFHAGSALYYGVKSVFAKDPEKKAEYRTHAQNNAIATGMLTLVIPAIVMVMLVAKPIFAILGVVGGVIGGLFAANNLHKLLKNSKKPSAEYKPLVNVNENAEAKAENVTTTNVNALIAAKKMEMPTPSAPELSQALSSSSENSSKRPVNTVDVGVQTDLRLLSMFNHQHNPVLVSGPEFKLNQ